MGQNIDLINCIEDYFIKRFIHEEPMVIEHARSLLDSVNNDILFLSTLEANQIYSYNFILNDVIYDGFKREGTYNRPKRGNYAKTYKHTRRSPNRKLISDLAKGNLVEEAFVHFTENLSSIPIESRLASYESPGIISAGIPHSTPMTARIQNVRGPGMPGFSSILQTPIPEGLPLDIMDSLNTDEHISLPLRHNDAVRTSVSQKGQQIHDSVPDFDSIGQIRDGALPQRGVTFSPLIDATPTGLASNIQLRGSQTGMIDQQVINNVDANVQSTPLRPSFYRGTFFEFSSTDPVIEGFPYGQQVVTLPEFDRSPFREFEDSISIRRREQALISSTPPRIVSRPASVFLDERHYTRELAVPIEVSDLSNLEFIREAEYDIINDIAIFIINTTLVPPPSRYSGTRRRIDFSSISVRNSPAEAPLCAQISNKTVPQKELNKTSSTSIPLIRGSPLEKSVPVQGSVNVEEQQFSIIQPISDVNMEVGQAENNQPIHAISDINDPIVHEDIQQPIILPEIPRSSLQDGLSRNWFEILRERDLIREAIIDDTAVPLHRRRKRRRIYRPPRIDERVEAHMSPITEQDIIMREIPEQQGEDSYRWNNFLELLQNWKMMVLETGRIEEFRILPRYSEKLLIDTKELGRAVCDILTAIISEDNVAQIFILPHQLSKSEAITKISTLLELQNRQVVCFTNSTNISISLNTNANLP